MFDRLVIENVLPISSIAEIAHYTRIGALNHFISDQAAGWGSAWATPVQFLNDRMEMSLGLEVLRSVANRNPLAIDPVIDNIDTLFTTFGRLETDAFQMSFSGNPDELGQWRGYGSNGMGCAVVTNVSSVHHVADVAGWVIYDPKEQVTFAKEIIRYLRRQTDNDLIEKVLVAAACYMKHDGFRPEMEFRLLKFPPLADVRFRESGDRLVPYVDYLATGAPLPIHRIILGPGWQLSKLSSPEVARNHVVQGVHRLLSARGLEKITSIESSRIPGEL